MSRAAVLAAPLLALALVSCRSDAARDPSGPALPVIDIRGQITELATPASDGSLGGMAVEGENQEDTQYSKAWVRIKDTTRITWGGAGNKTAATIADLQTGMRVEVKFAGVVAQLDPVQATAAEITIID